MAEHCAGLPLIWHVAALEAAEAGFPEIGPGHLLLALCKLADPAVADRAGQLAAEVSADPVKAQQDLQEVGARFVEAGLDSLRFRRLLRRSLGQLGPRQTASALQRGKESTLCAQRAVRLAADLGTAPRAVYLLHALLEEGEDLWAADLEACGARTEHLRERLPDSGFGPVAAPAAEEAPPAGRPGTLLERFGRDLTALAAAGKLEPVIGRYTELRAVCRVLQQQGSGNPILVGEPGVGKTAVVEGLAQRLRDLPGLQGKRLIEISLSGLLSGTRYRGDLEERLEGLLQEARHPEILLFIDEIHTLVAAGASSDAPGAGDFLKPALARGEIRCIGATTQAEYRRYLEKDPALRERFQVVRVEEPSQAETLQLLRGHCPGLEAHHELRISPESLEAVVELTVRYLPSERLPRKAIKLLRMAAADAQLNADPAGRYVVELTRADVARVLSEQLGVPLQQLTEEESDRLRRLETELRDRVKGQDQALAVVAKAVRRARLDLAHPDRPRGVFLFAGPTGTGKTELAKALARFLSGDERQLIRLDMSEFGEAHSRSRLIGAPAGYVGHEDSPALLEAVRSQPYSVVLLDEVEKAHSSVLQLFLQLFDEGHLTDGHGRRVSFRETFIIMTSNLGVVPAEAPGKLGFGASSATAASYNAASAREQTEKALRGVMSPELINRIGQIVVFRPLDPSTIRAVLERMLRDLQARLPVTLLPMEGALELLLERGFQPDYGARALERALNDLLLDPLGDVLLEGSVPKGARLRIEREGAALRFYPEAAGSQALGKGAGDAPRG